MSQHDRRPRVPPVRHHDLVFRNPRAGKPEIRAWNWREPTSEVESQNVVDGRNRPRNVVQPKNSQWLRCVIHDVRALARFRPSEVAKRRHFCSQARKCLDRGPTHFQVPKGRHTTHLPCAVPLGLQWSTLFSCLRRSVFPGRSFGTKVVIAHLLGERVAVDAEALSGFHLHVVAFGEHHIDQ